ncbi:hypothetical protein SynMVIR181_02008 [Synechococcus sp. MVIR-18-1]|nr:hypothetical protein SynMVIR181_02008 [Synechococcus sp. MVIR-18-1]
MRKNKNGIDQSILKRGAMITVNMMKRGPQFKQNQRISLSRQHFS